MHKTLLIFNGRFEDFTRDSVKIKALLIDQHEIQKVYYKKPLLSSSFNIKKIDLKGKWIFPGFTDCHTHLISRGLELQRIDLGKCRSLESCLRLINEKKGDYDIVFAQNYDDSYWKIEDKERLNRKTLDRITKKPLIMRRVCGHNAVVNSTALKYVPSVWQYIEPDSGRLYENAALFLNEIFKPDQGKLMKAVELGMDEAARAGVTTVHEIGDPERLELLLKLKGKSLLKTRFVLYLYDKYAAEMNRTGQVTKPGDDYVRYGGIKIFLDGSIGAQTAATSKPYSRSRNRGMILVSSKDLKKFVRNAEENGTQLMIHAIGDRAIELGLNAFKAYCDRKNPLRHRFEHLEIMDQRLIGRLARANIIASMQPNFVRRWQHPGGLYERYLGQRYIKMNPFASIKRAGIHLVFGSDNMPIGPIFGIKGATEHPSIKERLSIRETIAAYATKPAFAAFEEGRKGDFKPGKLADFVVLDGNPERIKNTDKMEIKLVLLGGEIIWKTH